VGRRMKRRGGRSRSLGRGKESREGGMRNNESERDGRTGSETPRSDRNRDRFRSAAFTSLIAALLVGRFMARPDCVEAGGQPRAFGV